MLVFLFALIVGSAVGWYSYAYRSYFFAMIMTMAGVGLVLAIAPVGPLVRQASITYDVSIFEVLRRMYWGLIPDPLEPAVMWIVVFAILAHMVTLFAYKGFEPVEIEPETRDESRRRVRADMRYSDDYFD
ncbi:MAG: hypothetical protein ACSHX3_12515 [Litorimonas sp.]